jgi:hypothetical protein
MKRRGIFFRNAIAALLSIVFAAGLRVSAAPVAEVAAAQLAPRSIFNLPANPKEGCDPFFPASQRPYETAVAAGSHAGDLTELRLNGVSGPPNHRLVIINNVTFAVGDDAEVRTPQGRIHIHCLEITGNSVVVEADGQRHELNY